MRYQRGPLVLGLVAALAFALAPLASASDGTGKETAQFSFKPQEKWTILLPNEQFKPISGSIPIPHPGGEGFTAEIDGTALAIDRNGDGRVDVKAKGTGGFVVLKSAAADQTLTYAVRLLNQGGWTFATGGVMTGKINGETVTLIDQNNDGTYDDVGEDAMIVGKSDSASFLSRVINVKGELFEITVSEDGSTVSYAPFNGHAGTLDMVGGFDCNGKLLSVVVKSESGQYSFELSSDKKGLRVPAGNYQIAWGLVEKGKESVKIRSGRMKPIAVGVDQVEVTSWGGPLEAEFEYTHDGDTLTISPQNLWFYGKSGEEYFGWVPDGQPPEFVVKNAKNNEKLLTARFGGC